MTGCEHEPSEGDSDKPLPGMPRRTKPQSSPHRISHREQACQHHPLPFLTIPFPASHIISPTPPRILQCIHARRTLFCFIVPHAGLSRGRVVRFIRGHLRTCHTEPMMFASPVMRWRFMTCPNRASCERPRTNGQRHYIQRRNHENIPHWIIKPHPYAFIIVTVIRSGMQSCRGVGMLTASHAIWYASSRIWRTIHNAGIALSFHDGNAFHPERAIHLHTPLYDSVITRIAGIRIFLRAMRTISCPSDWYSMFARLTGIMRKYMPDSVRRDMTMAYPSPVSCAVGHIENSSHNTIHDFMIFHWQNSVIPQSIFNVWHIPRGTVSILQRLRFFRLSTIA